MTMQYDYEYKLQVKQNLGFNFSKLSTHYSVNLDYSITCGEKNLWETETVFSHLIGQ